MIDSKYSISFNYQSEKNGLSQNLYLIYAENPAELEGEIFESLKPGLSAYADWPEKVRHFNEFS